MQTDTSNNTEEIAGQQTSPPPEPQPEAKAAPQPEAQADAAPAAKKKPSGKRKQKRHPIKSLLRILIALVIIAAGIYLILFAVAYFAKYDSIAAMLESMRAELSLMWQRISN